MRTSTLMFRDDEPLFRQSGTPNVYWLGLVTTLRMSDDELHKLRLAIDLVDDVVNGPMR
jgi:hypothetical protein